MEEKTDSDDEIIPIGIYEPQEKEGNLQFVRPEPKRLGDDWPRERILRTRESDTPKRVCLIGESTAAGFFYAPFLTPSKVLEHHLNAIKGASQYEVIDLTKVDMTADGGEHDLVRITVASLQLEPDVLVIFAGNNWSARAKPRAHIATEHFDWIVPPYEDAGPAGIMRLCEKAKQTQYESILAKLAYIANTAPVDVILVLPEVNLRDWERNRPVCWLKGDRTIRWHELFGKSIEAHEAENWPELSLLAGQMMSLDEETCPVSFRLMALSHLGANNSKAATEALIREMDSEHWLTGALPGTGTVVRQIMRTAPQNHGLVCVDLPENFAQHSSQIPGRELFLDYCHLTSEGIHVAMAAVAAEILKRDAMQLDGQSLLKTLPHFPLSPKREAIAMFLGGICALHWEQRPFRTSSLPEYWMKRALDTWSGISKVMMDYAAIHAAPLESWGISKAEQDLFGSHNYLEDRFHLLEGEGRRLQRMNLDGPGIHLICKILKQQNPAIQNEVDQMLIQHHSINAKPLNLIDPYYHWNTIDRQASYLDDEISYSRAHLFQAPWRSSNFSFVTDASKSAGLEITARIPFSEGSSNAVILVNGSRISQIRNEARWIQHKLTIPRQYLKRGINHLTIYWPRLTTDGDAAQHFILTRLKKHLPANLHPVFGELASLRIRSNEDF